MEAKPMGAKVRIAIMVNGKVDEIVDHPIGRRELKRDCDRLVDISMRPDIKVGTTWPFSTWAEYQATLKAEPKKAGT